MVVIHSATDHLPCLAIDLLLLRRELFRFRSAARRALPAGQCPVARLRVEMTMAVERANAEALTCVTEMLEVVPIRAIAGYNGALLLGGTNH